MEAVFRGFWIFFGMPKLDSRQSLKSLCDPSMFASRTLKLTIGPETKKTKIDTCTMYIYIYVYHTYMCIYIYILMYIDKYIHVYINVDSTCNSVS